MSKLIFNWLMIGQITFAIIVALTSVYFNEANILYFWLINGVGAIILAIMLEDCKYTLYK